MREIDRKTKETDRQIEKDRNATHTYPWVNYAFPFVVHRQVSTYQEDNGAAMEELLNFILLASGAPATEGPYQPPEVCVCMCVCVEERKRATMPSS